VAETTPGLGDSRPLTVGVFSAEPADDIKPPSRYRQWFHVNTMIVDKGSPLFADLGGMHNVYVNSTGLAALKKGGRHQPKKDQDYVYSTYIP
jgi:hypothetical protein